MSLQKALELLVNPRPVIDLPADRSETASMSSSSAQKPQSKHSRKSSTTSSHSRAPSAQKLDVRINVYDLLPVRLSVCSIHVREMQISLIWEYSLGDYRQSFGPWELVCVFLALPFLYT